MDVRPILSHELVVGDYLVSSRRCTTRSRRVEKLEYIDADLGQALGEPLLASRNGRGDLVGGARPAQRAGVVDQHQPGSVRSNRALAESSTCWSVRAKGRRPVSNPRSVLHAITRILNGVSAKAPGCHEAQNASLHVPVARVVDLPVGTIRSRYHS
jgi:hypothetical protein